MQTKLKGFWEKIKGFFAKLNKKTRILLGVCAGVILVLILAAVLLLNNKKEYEVLCTGLTASETSTVVQFLSDNGVTDYRINNDSILVPADRAIQLQVQLVTSGQLNSGFLYEFYTDNVGAFTTESERKEAIRIATEEKLAAMIRQFDGVRDASVNITLGTTRYYVLQDSATQSTAAVTITPDGNQELSAGVVEAIRYTVSHSVEELDIGSVSIVTTNGYVYNDTANSTGAMSDASALKLQLEQNTNNQIRAQVLEALEYVYGEGNVRVAVNTTVDIDRKVVEATEYSQPEGAVEGGGLIGTETWYWALDSNGTITAGGTVGSGPNTDVITYPELTTNPDGNATIGSASGQRNHEIDKVVTQREVLAGTITDVNVAVTINQNSENAEAMSVERLTNHVAVASGIGTNLEGWNSHVSVEIAPFAGTGPYEPVEPVPPTLIPGVDNWIVLAALAGIVLFLILLIIILLLRRRSKKKKLAAQLAAEAEMQEAAEAAAEAAAAAMMIPEAAPPTGGADIMEVNTEKSMELRKTVRQFAQNNPEIAAQMVKSWLKGGDDSGA